MRPITVRVSSATFSPWIPLNRLQRSFAVGIGVKLSSNANLAYAVQHTYDQLYSDVWAQNFVKISRTTTVATVTTKVNHGLLVGDWIQILNAGDPNLNGEYSVASVTSQTVFTYTVANTGAAADTGQATLQSARVFDNVILPTGTTTSGDTNYSDPVVAVRLLVGTYVAGYADMNVIQGV